MDIKQDTQSTDQSPSPQLTEQSSSVPAKAGGNGAAAPAKPAKKAKAPAEPQPPPQIDIEKFATNMAKVVEEGGKAFAAWLKPRAEGKVKEPHEQVADIVKTLGRGRRILDDRSAAHG